MATRDQTQKFETRRLAALERAGELKARPFALLAVHAGSPKGGGYGQIAWDYVTIGDFLSATTNTTLRTMGVGITTLERLHDALDRLIADQSTSAEPENQHLKPETPGEAIARGIREKDDDLTIRIQITRLARIERQLALTMRPDGTPRPVAEISAQALAIYAGMISGEFCDGLQGALEEHAQAMR